jgi:hypothetical protein
MRLPWVTAQGDMATIVLIDAEAGETNNAELGDWFLARKGTLEK